MDASYKQSVLKRVNFSLTKHVPIIITVVKSLFSNNNKYSNPVKIDILMPNFKIAHF